MNTHLADARAYLAGRMGADIELEGQSWLLVGLKGRWAVLENEDERIKHVGMVSLARLLRADEARRANGGDV